MVNLFVGPTIHKARKFKLRHRPHSSLAGMTPNEYANRSKKDQNLNRANLN
mgnify:CR=1 FL=1